MKVTQVQIQGFRSFSQPSTIALGAITVLIGANNAGKSSVLRALYSLQQGHGDLQPDIRRGSAEAVISISLTDITPSHFWGGTSPSATYSLTLRPGSENRVLSLPGGHSVGGNVFPAVDPHHFIVPYLSKRKTVEFAEEVNQQAAASVLPQMTNLPAKLAKISNPAHPRYERYRSACEEVLGCFVTAIPSGRGMRAGVYLEDGSQIWIDQMGEGVPNVVSLLVDLALSDGKLFLIEELENDLHPQALKGLLDLIVLSSTSNQFVVSTHSNIVLRYLGAVRDAMIYRVEADRGIWPIEAHVSLVASTSEARLGVLRDLGYALSDFDLWDGWLILEESSAERLIRDYLIPWFAPRLSRLRTLAANGVDDVNPTFQDFNRLTRFTHLEATYRGSAWVRVDGDGPGKLVIERLRQAYPDWPSDNFRTFSEPQFESYYPREFQEAAAAALAISNKQEKRIAKRQLLLKVVAWLDADAARGRSAIEESAREIVDDLRAIEALLVPASSAAR